MTPKRILITYGWCRTAYVATRCLAQAGYEVYVCDNSNLAMTRFSRYCKKFVKVPDPFSSPQHYAEEVFKLSEKYNIDCILPIHEDVIALYRYTAVNPTSLPVMLAPDLDILQQVMDKSIMRKIASETGIPLPFSGEYTSRSELASLLDRMLQHYKKVIMKPRHGNSGKGIYVLDSTDDIEKSINLFEKNYGKIENQKPVVEQFIEGDVFGVCFLAKNGVISLQFSERYIMSKSGGMGTSVYREPYNSASLHESAKKLASRLNWSGIGHFDFIGNGNDTFYFLEMNPRLWGGINNSIANGYNFPVELVDSICGHAKHHPNPKPQTNKRTMWMLGMFIAVISSLKSKKFSEAFEAISLIMNSKTIDYDDYNSDDKAVFFAQCAHYFTEFVKSGGNINPERPEMVIKT